MSSRAEARYLEENGGRGGNARRRDKGGAEGGRRDSTGKRMEGSAGEDQEQGVNESCPQRVEMSQNGTLEDTPERKHQKRQHRHHVLK